MRKFILIIYCTLISVHPFAQTGFAKTFSLGLFTEAHQVIQTPDSGFIVCGATADTVNTFFWKIFLLKLDKNGDSVWSRKYGPFSEPDPRGICQLSNGNFVIGFNTHYAGYDFWLNFLVTNAQGDSLNYIPRDTTFSASQMLQGGSGNIYISGSYLGWNYACNCGWAMLRKYDKELNVIWTKHLESDNLFNCISYPGELLISSEERLTVEGGFISCPDWPIINEIDSSGAINWYLTASDITTLSCYSYYTSIGRANGGIIFSTDGTFSSGRLLTNLDPYHLMLWQRKIYINPVFFHQWNNGIITMLKDDFGFMDISNNGDSLDISEDYVLDNSSVYGVAMSNDESIIAVGVDCSTCYWDHDQAYVVKFKPTIVGIKNLSSNSEMIFPFPNPSDKNVALNFSSYIESLTLFSCDGKLLRQFNHLHQSKFDLDVSDLSSGMYFIEASSGNKIYRGKILVAH